MVILYSVQQLCATALKNMDWSLLIPFCCSWMSDAYWDCTDITRWRRLCIKWDCIQNVSWFSGINALQRNQKLWIYFYVCELQMGQFVLHQEYCSLNLETTHSKLKLMTRWASGWELQLLEITGNCGRRNIWQGSEQHRLLKKGDHKERALVLCTSDLHLEWQCWTATYKKYFTRYKSDGDESGF